jgi:hypothetical protein
MLLRVVKIFKLDGVVVRPRKSKVFVDVTKEEAFRIRRRGHAIFNKNYKANKDSIIIKSKAKENEDKPKSVPVSVAGGKRKPSAVQGKADSKVSKGK